MGSGALAAQLPGFPASPWYEARGAIIWIGARLPALHPRAVMTAVSPPRGAALRLGPIPRSAWSARLPVLDERARGQVIRRARRLRNALAGAQTPQGFGTLLGGMPPPFPLDRALASVEALGEAFECGDPRAAFASARPLLGLGAGLTPSGDDLVGGALFGNRFLTSGDRRWRTLALRLVREIGHRSHPVSAALFSDLAAGRSFAPLHEMADALAAGAAEAALSAARALTAIGHSSGWDLLAGFFLAVCGLPAPTRRGSGFPSPRRARARCSAGS